MEEKNPKQGIRLDTWLWAVRLFKTRALSKDKCMRGHVRLEGQKIKASRKVVVGMVLEVKKEGFWRKFEVLDLLDKRVGAKLAIYYVKEVTEAALLKRYKEIASMPRPYSIKGERPTKKNRRELDKVRHLVEQSFNE